jgi:hypothetical protein
MTAVWFEGHTEPTHSFGGKKRQISFVLKPVEYPLNFKRLTKLFLPVKTDFMNCSKIASYQKQLHAPNQASLARNIQLFLSVFNSSHFNYFL